MRYHLGTKKSQTVAPKLSDEKFSGAERRRYARIALQAPVRMLINHEIETYGTVTHISPGSLTVHSLHPIGINDHVVAYVADIDRFQGSVRRKVGRLFTMDLHMSENKREKLVETLIVELAKRDLVVLSDQVTPDRRATKRQLSMSKHSICTLEDGFSFPCSVEDMSMTGLGIVCEKVLQIGQKVQVGKVLAQIIRETETGYGLEILENGTLSIDVDGYNSERKKELLLHA